MADASQFSVVGRMGAGQCIRIAPNTYNPFVTPRLPISAIGWKLVTPGVLKPPQEASPRHSRALELVGRPNLALVERQSLIGTGPRTIVPPNRG